MFLCEHGSPIDQSPYDLKLKAPAEETEILSMSGQRFGELQGGKLVEDPDPFLDLAQEQTTAVAGDRSATSSGKKSF